MTEQSPPEDPEGLERTWLPLLQQNYNAVVQYFSSLSEQGRQMPAEYWAQYADQFENYARSYLQLANYLQEVGLPRMAQLVAQILNDMAGVKRTWLGDQRTNTVPATGGPSGPGALDWTTTIDSVVKTRQAAFDEWMTAWRANFTQSCRHCGYCLGNSYYYSKNCPRCGRLLMV